MKLHQHFANKIGKTFELDGRVGMLTQVTTHAFGGPDGEEHLDLSFRFFREIAEEPALPDQRALPTAPTNPLLEQ